MAGSKRAAGVRTLFKPSVPGIPAEVYPYEHPAAPPIATILLALGVVLPPFGRLDATRLVDVEQAPYPSAASRLSAASSNTRVPPLIRPYPPRHPTLMKIQAPTPQMRWYLKNI
jgi:hypothetical protein